MNPDPGCYEARDPVVVLSSSSGLDNNVALGGGTGHSDLHGPSFLHVCYFVCELNIFLKCVFVCKYIVYVCGCVRVSVCTVCVCECVTVLRPQEHVRYQTLSFSTFSPGGRAPP